MIPIILVADAEKTGENFIGNFVSKNNFKSSSIYKITPEGKEFSIAQIRAIRRQLIIDTGKRLFILYSFDSASFEAQNALLKTLEEKTDNNQFILAVKNPNLVVLTIQSRSKVINLILRENTKSNPDINKFVEKLINSKALNFMADSLISGVTREEALEFIDGLIVVFRERLKKSDPNSPSVVKKAFELRMLLQNNNLNPQLAIDNLLIFIHKAYTMNIEHKT